MQGSPDTGSRKACAPAGAAAGLLASLRLHHSPSWRHSLRVSAVARQVARAYGVGGKGAAEIEAGSRLHDIGKLRVPRALLAKPSALDDGEERWMRTHPEWGLYLIRVRAGGSLETAARIASAHHERWDGAGYPARLRGLGIPFEARIAAVADAYDALRSPREYKPAGPHGEAMERIAAASGSHFDPEVAETLAGCQDLVERRWEEAYAEMPEADLTPESDVSPV